MSTIEAGRPVLPSQAASPGRDVAASFDTASGASPSLPDPQVLTRLANEMFSALPGPGPVASGVSRPAAEAIAEPAQLLGAVAPSADTVAHGTAAPHPPLAGASLPVTSPPTIPLPWEAELRALLTPLAAPRTPAAVEPPGFGSSGESFYFLDGVQPSAAGRFPGMHSPGVPPRTESAAHPPFDVNAIRRDFPILGERVHGRPLIWLDNAATTQKPQAVIDRLAHFYLHENSNIHRGAHELAARATDAYEAARESVRRFLNASSADEIVFVRGATEAINLVAQSWGRQNIGRDDEIVITWLEHHANIVPWQQLCSEKGARLRVAPVDDHGQVLLDAYEKLLGPRTRLVAFPHVSNALGTVTPARQMVEMARRYGAHVLIDGAQAVSHMRADVQSLDCDWYVLSGHKVFAPTGIGALYGRRQVLEAMPPWQGGGNMIECVTFEKTEYQAAPARFEAGTGSIADAVGLGAAIDYLERIGIENVNRYEHELLVYATRLLSDIPGLRLIGTAPEKAVVLSFVLDGFRSEDVGAALDREGIAVRAGHHCAQPILRRFGLESTVRPSLALYNTFADIDALAAALHRIRSGSPLIG
jgi:cysteine desulfurase / selenocysteine lyase